MSFHSSSRDALVAKLLAAAISMRCPKVNIVKAHAESYGFCVEFYIAEPISQEFFPFLEETMYQLLQERDLKVSEMIPYTAREFLKYHHQKARARALEDYQEALVQTIAIGTYTDFFEQEIDLVKALEEPIVFKLLSLSQHKEVGRAGEPKTRVRIQGISSTSQQVLKGFAKQIKKASLRSHTRLQHVMVIDEEEQEVVWLPEGVALKRKVLSAVKNSLEQMGFTEIEAHHISCIKLRSLSQLESYQGYFYLSQQEGEGSEERGLGLYGLAKTTAMYAQSRSIEVQTCFEGVCQLLQGLGFSWTICLERAAFRTDPRWSFLPESCEKIPSKDKGERVRFFIKDSFERNWEVACIEIDEKKKPSYVTISFSFLERLIALSLEMSDNLYRVES